MVEESKKCCIVTRISIRTSSHSADEAEDLMEEKSEKSSEFVGRKVESSNIA